MQATYRHGCPLMVDYTPSGAAVAAGDVIVAGKVPWIAHNDIADGELGALAAGGGVYLVTAAEAQVAGDKVYWNDTTNKVTKTAAAGAHEHFGFVLPSQSAAGDGSTLLVQHSPDGTTI